jgi:sn-glycerol 3-phosphate transport system substrate-binding protein
MRSKQLLAFFLLAVTAGTAHTAQTAVELQLWHSMDDALGVEFNALVRRFNASQTAYKVVPQYKGSYDETLAAGLAAIVAGAGPHILQVYEVGTANMIAAQRAVMPVYQLMRDAGENLDPGAFVPAVASFYSDSAGNLVALPFSVSTPVLYVNQDALKAAGVSPRTPLKTWYQVQDTLLEIRDKHGAQCGLTTTWPAWVMLENLLALHNEEFASRNNGYDGIDAQLTFNTRLAVRHLSLMTAWEKANIFTYSGRHDEGEVQFARGRCAMLTASSASYANLARNAKFRFTIAPLPYYDDINDAPYNTLISGASLWAIAGKQTVELKGVAKFFAFVARPDVQAEWHQKTGYLPITRAAYDLTRQSKFYEPHPETEVALQELMNGGAPKTYSRGIRLGNYSMIRTVVDEEFEQAWALVKTPKQALDDAIERGNAILDRFQRVYQRSLDAAAR